MIHRAEAWETHRQGIERASLIVGNALLAGLLPFWVLIDALEQPQHFRAFLPVRAVALAVTLVALGWHLTRRSPRVGRWLVVASMLTLGVGVAWMLSRIDDHYSEYLFGFSLLFWGLGLVVMWPWHFTAGVHATMLAVHAGFTLTGPAHLERDALFGYLVSAAIISTTVNYFRLQVERRAFNASSELSQRNTELATALERLKDAQTRFVATEKLSAVGRLLAQLSHEINNPVNVLQNNLEPIADHLEALSRVLDAAHRVPGEAGAEVRSLWKDADIDFVRADVLAALSDMRTAAGRIRTLHQDLRAFLRGGGPDPIEGDVNEQVRATIAMCRRNVPEGVQLIEHYGALPHMRLVPGQLSQVVLNLVQNALDAVGPRGEVEVATSQDGGDVVLSVRDTGPGIPQAARAHLFEPFFTTKPVGQGTGLGLATSYQIVTQHGGTLSLDESCANGTRFLARLPIRAVAGQSAAVA